MGADHFREATKKLYDVELLRAVAAAVVVAAVAAVRIRDNIGRAGTRAKRGNKVIVLCRLRCCQLVAEKLLVLLGNLRVLRRKLLRRQTLVDAAEAAVHGIDDVARGVLHGVAGVARLRRHVIAYLGDCSAVFAAALLCLHRHVVQLLHKRGLLVAAGKLGLSKAACHRHVGAVDKLRLLVKSVAKSLIYTVDLALDVGEVRGQHIAVYNAAGISAVVAESVSISAPAAENGKEQDDDLPAIITAEAAPAATCHAGRRDGHCHGRGAVIQTHIFHSFRRFKRFISIVATILIVQLFGIPELLQQLPELPRHLL